MLAAYSITCANTVCEKNDLFSVVSTVMITVMLNHEPMHLCLNEQHVHVQFKVACEQARDEVPQGHPFHHHFTFFFLLPHPLQRARSTANSKGFEHGRI